MKRLDVRVEATQQTIEAEQKDMVKKGLILCYAKHEQIGRICMCVFLKMRGWRGHTVLGKHVFLSGENAKTRFLRESSKPGGLVSSGGRVDQSSSVLTGKVIESESCVCEQQVICFRAFNRKET
jgi:hypothetical protein